MELLPPAANLPLVLHLSRLQCRLPHLHIAHFPNILMDNVPSFHSVHTRLLVFVLGLPSSWACCQQDVLLTYRTSQPSHQWFFGTPLSSCFLPWLEKPSYGFSSLVLCPPNC